MATQFLTSVTAKYVPANAGTFDPPSNAWYAEVALSPRTKMSSFMKRVIGTEGKAMKAITHQARVSYMWYFPERHSVGIWAVYNNFGAANTCIENAKHRLLERENFIMKNYLIQAIDENIKEYIDSFMSDDEE